MTKKYIYDLLTIQKIFAFIVTVIIFGLCVNHPVYFILVAIILGYSHFMIGALYKVLFRHIGWYKPILLALLGIVLYGLVKNFSLEGEGTQLLTLIVTVYAVYHVVIDDQFTGNLFESKYTFSQKLGCISLVSLLSSLQLSWQYKTNDVALLAMVGIIAGIIYGANVIKNNISLSQLWVIFQIVGTFSLLISKVRFKTGIGTMIAFIGIYHYLLFYMHYYMKIVSIEKPKNALHTKKGYITIVIITNAGFLLTYFVYRIFSINSLYFLYDYHFFLILSLIHFISSTRYYEIRGYMKKMLSVTAIF